jgi:nucleotide-binding universal stress UspA family protein
LGVRKAGWHVAEGFPPDALARLGNWHDLLVFERNDEMPWESAGELGALILRIGMPCIVVPPAGVHDPARLECVALAWNGTPEALRAAHAARNWLQRARRVVVLSGRRRQPAHALEWHPPFDVLSYLKQHEIRAEVHEVAADDADAGPALLGAAAALHADLLVMGAYGRSRFSEWIFGGATRHVLGNARIPVLLRH